MAGLQLPRLYPIVDASRFSAAPDPLAALLHFAGELIAGGATLLQYRGKALSPRAILSQARELNRAVSGRATLIMNDRADLCLAAGFDGVHLGQDDLAPEEARRIFENVAGGAQIKVTVPRCGGNSGLASQPTIWPRQPQPMHCRWTTSPLDLSFRPLPRPILTRSSGWMG